eukprot:175365_1
MTIIDDYDIKLSARVLWIILATLNCATLILTGFNWYALHQGFKNMKIYDPERRRIIWFYYEITLVPLLVAGCGHYGAQYPKQAIWIFPSLQIFLGFNFFWFLGMMYQSAGGYENVKFHLWREKDRCGFPRMENRICCLCCMKQNLWFGMKSRLWYLYLIYVKPLWAFSLSIMSAVKYQFPDYSDYIARSLVLLCTLIPLNAIKCFVVAIEPISRLNRIRPKLQLIRVMVPILQIQQLTITFLVNNEYITDLQNVKKEYRGSRIEGTLLSFEMLIIAMASHFIYRAEDLKHWEHKQQYQWERQPPTRTTNDYNNDYDDYDDDHLSGISGISALSINAPSSLLIGYKNKNNKQQLISMPEDHSLRELEQSLQDDQHTNHILSNGAKHYRSLDDIVHKYD